jgi:hypothetical protein
MTVDQRGIHHHHGRNLCRSLGKSLDCLKPTPPTGATSRRRPPRGGHPNASAFGRGRLLEGSLSLAGVIGGTTLRSGSRACL